MQENMETQFNHIDTNNLEPSQVVPTLSDSDEIFDMGDDFDFGEFASHHLPSTTAVFM